MITVIETVSAHCHVLPSMYIYKCSAHLMGWHAAVQKKEIATFAWWLNGLTDREVGFKWVE